MVIKLIELKIEEIPPKCKDKIAMSTDKSPWKEELDKGGYTVQPVPAPLPKVEDEIKKIKAGNNNQKLKLFIRGKCISGVDRRRGMSQLPNPPISTGITTKKIITKAWEVTITL